MSSRRFCVAALSLSVLFLVLSLSLNAQSTYGSLSGTVVDSTAAAVAAVRAFERLDALSQVIFACAGQDVFLHYEGALKRTRR